MFDGFATRIKQLIKRGGRIATYRTFVNSGPDYNPTQTPVDTDIYLIEFDFDASERDGSIITSNDTEFAIISDIVIDKKGKIVDKGVEYEIMSVDDVMPGDDPFMYVVQGRV